MAGAEVRERRSKGELLGAVRRLWPHIAARRSLLIALVLWTLCWAGTQAARASLIKTLLNDVMLRGGPKADPRDNLYALDAPKDILAREKSAATTRYTETFKQLVALEDLGLPRPYPLTAAPALKQERLAQILHRTDKLIRDMAEEYGAILAAPAAGLLESLRHKQERAGERLARAVAYQKHALALLGPDLVKAPEDKRVLAAALSLEARAIALEANFAAAQEDLLWIFGAAVLIAFGLGIFHYKSVYTARALVTMIVVDIQNRLAQHLLTLSIRFFNDERRGELFSRLTNDLTQVHNVLTTMLSDLVVHFLTLVVLATVAFFVSVPLALSLVALSLVVVVPVRVWGRKIRRSARARQAQVANVLESMQQMFAGIRIVKAFRREEHETDRFHERTREYLKAGLAVVSARTASKSWMEFVNDVTVPVVLLVGGVLVVKNTWGLDFGRFGMFTALVLSMYMPAKAVAQSYNTLQDSLASVDRVFEIFGRRPEIVDAPDAVALEKVKEGIAFENVSFHYDPQRPVLRDVSFTAKAGEVTAIVGPTAAGKSTLVDLVARFYDPTGGRVLVDGQDLKKVKLASLLDRVAVVSQEPFLFNDSLLANIRYGRLDATDAEVEAAATAARIHDEIVAMPEGYKTNVGERGAKLSGGQRQRITIARAILRNPEILILDEAMSALDTQTERKVQEALEVLEHGRTTFAIAHRLSTVRHAHRILVLSEGALVEQGKHDELIAKGGLYSELVKRQELRDDPPTEGSAAAA